ncbi:Trm112 family protein [Bartonella raoultii]|uniref:Trm112 family protein n=1 Tax=Bartonella raoultii TaxID=1457020 RepID=UPI001ABA0570|nr:Trm112 family protein [Bartonella raoultii]
MKKMTTDPKMLELLVCPMTRGTLSFNRKTQELISLKAKLAYPIRDGVPIMLTSEARPLQNNKKTTHKK